VASLNKIFLIGNLTRDPEMKYTPQGKAVCKFGLAINMGFGEKKKVIFLNIVCWEKTADAASNCLYKGASVHVEGRLDIREYTTEDGQKRTATEIIADRLEFLTRREATAEQPPADEGMPF
jgi:single-strand DNA-binding protein